MLLYRNPVLCNYYVTYRCNAKCGFCDIWERPSPYVKLEDVRANLSDLRKMGVKVVDFTGGEPLLHRELPDFLRIAREMGFITTLTTNALLYPKYAERLQGLVDMLHFSLDSPDRESHNASRGVACFDHLIESIGIAKKLGEQPDILFTVFENNIGEIQRVYEEISLPNELILVLNPVFEYKGVGEELSPSALAAMKSWQAKPGVYLNEGFLKLRENGGNKISDPVCRAGTATVVISPENELILPCYHLEMHSVPINGNLREIYFREDVVAARKQAGFHAGCEGCTINCYMEPSMAVKMNELFFRSLKSTLKYSLEKWVFA